MMDAIIRALVRLGVVEYADDPATPLALDELSRMWYARHGR